jgi:parallel beta-helix repeat protein
VALGGYSLSFPVSAAEKSNNIVPVNLGYPWGNLNRYGNNTTPGTTDMFQALQNALLCNAAVYVPAGTYAVSTAVELVSGVVLYGDGATSVLLYANGSMNNLECNGLTNVTIRDLKINVTGSGATTTWAGVRIFNSSTYITVERVEFAGLNWAGVWIAASNYCVVRNCYFHNFNGTTNDQTDIIITDDGSAATANYNIIADNLCFGGGWVGIAFMQFYGGGGAVPLYGIASGNRVGQHTAYGILFYNVTNNVDSWHQAVGNYVENIQGTVLTGNSGAGIYCAGAGGCTITGNTIRNCGVSTSSSTLVPAGIAINGSANLSPFTISGNFVLNHQHYYGIACVGCPLGGTITGNNVSLQTGAPLYGIYAQDSSNVSIVGNTVNILNSLTTTDGIFAFSSTQNMTNIVVADNVVIGCSDRGIRLIQGSNSLSNFTVNGNIVTGGGASCIPIGLVSINTGSVCGNICTSAFFAILVNGVTNARYANNYLSGTGATTVSTTGTCTGSYFDKTNVWSGGATTMVNGATGLLVEWSNNAVPAAGTWGAGDRTEQSVPAFGAPNSWRCTVAGSPGTWIAEQYFDGITPYAYGTFTAPTGNFLIMAERLQLTGAQRATLQGTGRLRIT